MDTHLKMRREKRGLFLSCGRTLAVLLEWRRVCQGTSWVASRVSRTLSRLNKEGGISLEMPQQKRASSDFEVRISWFFLSSDRKLGVPLELRQGPQGPARVASGKSSLHASCEGPLRIPLTWCLGLGPHHELRLQPQVSFPGLTWIRRSYGVSTGEWGLLSCGDMQVRFSLELSK